MMPFVEPLHSKVINNIGLKFLVWLGFFILITTFNWEYRYQSPIWDTAGGLFAPAEYLYRSNLDLFALLKEDGFSKGGPNVHVYNIVTFITAFDMWIFDGDKDLIYLSLHIFQFAIGALILYCIFYIALPIFGPKNSTLMAIAVFVFPPFVVQTRYMYVELIGSVFLVFAYSAWIRGQYNKACVAAIAACSVKSFGLALILVLIILIFIDKGRAIKRRVLLVSGMLFLAFSFELLRWSQHTNIESKMPYDYSTYILNSFIPRLQHTPDLFAFLNVLMLVGVWFFVNKKINWRADFLNTNKTLGVSELTQRMIVGGVLVIGAFLGFIITVPLTGVLFFPLTRYYMWIWPLVIPTLFSLIFVFSKKFSNPENEIRPFTSNYAGVSLVLLIIYFIANNSGRYYPRYQDGIGSFSVVERSTEYEAFNKMQRHLLHFASTIDKTPVYLNLVDYYFSSSVLMGYVDEKKENFKNIVTSFDEPGELPLYPDRFILVYSNVGHGGATMNKLIKEASKLPQYKVEIINSFTLEGFDGFIYRITRTNT